VHAETHTGRVFSRAATVSSLAWIALSIAASATASLFATGANAGVMFLPYRRQDGNSNATFDWWGRQSCGGCFSA
jgi:hypothetical protein